MTTPLYRPSLDFNTLPVPPNYIPGSLRGDKGFRTSAEKIISTPISFCKSELKTLKDLNLLHAPQDSQDQNIQKDEQTIFVKEPKCKKRSAMMPSVYDFTFAQRFESLTNDNAYRCYKINFDGLSTPALYSTEEKNYVKEVADLELECHRNPAIISLWLKLITVHYKMSNLERAATATLDMFNNMDYLCSYQKLWDLLLSDDSVAMKSILEYYNISAINSIFKLILMNLDTCIPTDNNTPSEGHIFTLIDCKCMVLCANIFCMLFLSSSSDLDTKEELHTVCNSLVDSLLYCQTHNYIYFLAIIELLHLYIHDSTLYCQTNLNLQSYKQLVNNNYRMSKKIIVEDAPSNIFLGAYILTESIIQQNSERIIAVTQHAINGAFNCPTPSPTMAMHSKQLEKLVCGIGSFSSPILSAHTNSCISIERSLVLLQKLMCKDSSLHTFVNNVIGNEPGTIDLASINNTLRNTSIEDEDKDKILLAIHIGKLACLSILRNIKKSSGKGLNCNDLKELLTYIEYSNKKNAVPEIIEYLIENGIQLYHQSVLKTKISNYDKLEIGLLLLSICKSTKLAEILFKIYERAIKRCQSRQNNRCPYQRRLNTLPRIECMILYAQRIDFKETIIDCANGHGSLYQGALKEAILTCARHVFPYTATFIDKLLMTESTCNWLQPKVSSLLHGAKCLLDTSKDKSAIEIATCLHNYAVSISVLNISLNTVQLSYIIKTLEILMLSRAEGITQLKNSTDVYIQTPWASAIMALFISEQSKAILYWEKWSEYLKQNYQSIGTINSPAEHAFESILLECNSITFNQEHHIDRDNARYCILNVISVILFYSYTLN